MRNLIRKKFKIEITLTLLIFSSLFTTNLIMTKAEDSTTNSYITPGVEDIPLDQIIKIGILDDMDHFSGVHAWEGAFLAAEEINLAGGITIGTTQYYVGLVSEDTNEAELDVDPEQGVAAAEKMISDHNPHFVTGGFRNDSLIEYIETIMDSSVPFIGTGCANDIFCQNVLNQYNRYKYFFRVSPVKSSRIGWEFIVYAYYYFAKHLTAILGTEVNRIALIYEDLPWVYPMITALHNNAPPNFLEIVKEIAFPISATAEDFTVYWNEINKAGAQITLSLIVQTDGILLSQTYAEVQPKCLVLGINVPGQLDSYYIDTNGGCQYEIQMQFYRTAKTPLSIPFWDNFVEKYEHEPFSTGVGSYDAVYLLVQAAENTGSLDPDAIVTSLEGIDTEHSFTGASGNIAFDLSHDLVVGEPYGYSLFCQWQEGGTKVVLSSGNIIYQDDLATGSLMLPEWGINHEEPFVRFGIASGPATIDPHDAYDTSSIHVIDQVVESLFAYDLSDPECSIIPKLALDFGTWSEDGLSYMVPLREDVFFHDGTKFDAYAVQWNFERLAYFLNPPPGTSQSKLAPLLLLPDGTPIIDSVKVIDLYQVKFKLNSPYSPLEALLSCWATGILSPSSTPKEQYINLYSKDLIGTGPFTFDGYSEGMSVRFGVFEEYWNGRANVNDLAFLIIEDNELRNLALLEGKIDFLADPMFSMIEIFQSIPDITVKRGKSASIFYLGMNNELLGKPMRQAISYAINYSYIIDEIYDGKAVRLRSPVPEGILYANSKLNVATMNVENARQILHDAEIGTELPIDEDGPWITIAEGDNPIATYIYARFPSSLVSVNIGDLIYENLKLIGIKVLIVDFNTFAEFLDTMINHQDDIQLFYLGWLADFNDPCDYLNYLFSCSYPSSNLAHVNDEYLEGLLSEGLIETDPTARALIYDEIQRYLVEDLMPWAYLFIPINYDAYSNKYLGYQTNPLGKVWFYPVYAELEEEEEPPDTTPPMIMYDTIPDEIKITYTRSAQIIGSIKAVDTSNIIYIGWDSSLIADPGFSLISTYSEGEIDGNDIHFSETVVMTTNLLEPGIHELTLMIADDHINIYVKNFIVEVYRQAELKLSGEFDYLEKEKVKISIAAQVFDLEEKFPLNATSGIDFTVYIRIVDYNGDVKLEVDEMNYDSNGFFHWDSIFTIDSLKHLFPKGIYIVQGWIEFSDNSYYEGGDDAIQFHIDPPSPSDSTSYSILEIFGYGGLIIVSIALTFLFLRERRQHVGLKG